VLAGELVKQQSGFNALSTENAQSAILNMPAFIACACEAWSNCAQVKKTEGYLKLISGAETLTLDETNGTETIAKAKDPFNGYLDSDFRNWNLDVPSQPTKEQKVSVFEMTKNGTFSQIYNGLSSNLDSLCLTQA
jgi:hypothetical protein